MKATLELFNCVPLKEESGEECEPLLLEKYGIAVRGEATKPQYVKEIKEWAEHKILYGESLNQSFHKSWKKIKESSKLQLRTEQVLHYLSTYGLYSLGIHDSGLIYIPSEQLDIPDSLPLRVIIGVPVEQIIKRNFELLNGMALKRETIDLVLSSLKECGYKFTGREYTDVANKEASILIADLAGIRPTSPDLLFRYIYFKMTGGETLVIKNRAIYQKIQEGTQTLPSLTDVEMMMLAQTFNRYKPIWMAIKSASDDNRPIVNRISKLSKKFHVPKPINVLETLTSSIVPQEELKKAARSAPTSHLIKAINAVGEYYLEPYNRFYRIRNGKGWTHQEGSLLTAQDYLNNQTPLMQELAQRLDRSKPLYCPSYINYAIPSSEKQYLGNIPSGTQIDIPEREDTLLLGVYWEGEEVDLDLSAVSLEGKIGWDGNYTTEDKELMFSGDITSAPDGATEWLYSKNIDFPYLIKLNLFSGAELGHKFKFIVGFSNDKDINKNYVIDPSKVLIQIDCEVLQENMLLGLLIPQEEGTSLYLSGQGVSNTNVSGSDLKSKILLSNLVARHKSMLKLRQMNLNFVDDPEESEANLSPNTLTKDSIKNLIN